MAYKVKPKRRINTLLSVQLNATSKILIIYLLFSFFAWIRIKNKSFRIWIKEKVPDPTGSCSGFTGSKKIKFIINLFWVPITSLNENYFHHSSWNYFSQLFLVIEGQGGALCTYLRKLFFGVSAGRTGHCCGVSGGCCPWGNPSPPWCPAPTAGNSGHPARTRSRGLHNNSTRLITITCTYSPIHIRVYSVVDPDPPDSYYFHSLDPDPHQMIRIRIQQNLFKTENKFLLRTEILFCMDQICVIFFYRKW